MKLNRTAKIGLAVFGAGVLIFAAVAIWMKSLQSTGPGGPNRDDAVFAGAAFDEIGLLFCIVGVAIFLISILIQRRVSRPPKS